MKLLDPGPLGILHVLSGGGETGVVRFLVPCWRFQMFILPAAPHGCHIVLRGDSFAMKALNSYEGS